MTPCTSIDPLTDARCEKMHGHIGDHGGVDRTGTYRAWLK